ncbi:MAG: addiction module protein [Kiritimatiellia bacterium]
MKTQIQDVLVKAVDLSPVDRAVLVEGILSSFDVPAGGDIDDAWAFEAEERIEAYERGEIESITAFEVFEKIEKNYSP